MIEMTEMTENKTTKKWMILCLVAFAAMLLMSVTIVQADDVYAGEARVTGKALGAGGVFATEDTPANVQMVPHPYQASPIVYYGGGFDYEGLEPGKQYKVTVALVLGWNGLEMKMSRQAVTMTVSDTGSGSWVSSNNREDITFWRNGWTGDGRVEITLTPEDGVGEEIKATAIGQSMSVKLKGLSYMEINSPDAREISDMKYAVLDELSDTTEISGLVRMVNLEPNREYTITAYCTNVQGWEDSYFWYPTRVSDNVTQTVTTDENGSVTFEPVYEVETSKLKPNTICMSMFSVRCTDPNGTDTATYSFSGNPNYGMFYYMFIEKEMLLYLIGDKEAVNTPTKVDVTVSNLVKDRNALIPGARFNIVKGNDPDSGEVVKSWTQGKEPYKTRLNIGEYTLVQIEAPPGYELAEPVTFTLTDNDAGKREYSFLSDRKLSQTPDGEYIYHMSIFKFDEEDEAEKHQVVYCINHGRGYTGCMDPSSMKLMYYTEYDIEDPILATIIDKPRVEIDELRKKLKQIAYGGYPNDKLGLKGKYSLSSSQLLSITQAAIHYYTDSMPYVRDAEVDGESVFENEDMYQAFLQLINADMTLPEGMTLKVYIPDNSDQQAVLSTLFRETDPEYELEVFNVSVDPPPEDVEESVEDKEARPEEIIQKKADVKDVRPDDSADGRSDGSDGSSKTGDENRMIPMAMVMLMSASFIFALARRRMSNR